MPVTRTRLGAHRWSTSPLHSFSSSLPLAMILALLFVLIRRFARTEQPWTPPISLTDLESGNY